MKTDNKIPAEPEYLRQKAEEQLQKSFARSTSLRNLLIIVAMVYVVSTAIIILSELINDMLLPRFSLWEVHILTIIGIPILVTILAYMGLRKEAELYQNIVRENMERRHAEEKLKQLNHELKELNATKDKFFSIVAHDLKNPFTSILGSTELLYENIYQMDAEEIRQLSQILNDSAKSGFATLQNLLDWSRSHAGLIKINLEEVNLKNLVEDNISNLLLYSRNKEINLDSDIKDDLFVFTDRNMINIVLRNLIGNAIKFTPRFGNVKISSNFDANMITILLKDNGIGISDDDINKLFRMDSDFRRPGTDKEQGTGLGLKISKEFIEKLGGKIWVESELGKGCEFRFTLPTVKPRVNTEP